MQYQGCFGFHWFSKIHQNQSWWIPDRHSTRTPNHVTLMGCTDAGVRGQSSSTSCTNWPENFCSIKRVFVCIGGTLLTFPPVHGEIKMPLGKTNGQSWRTSVNLGSLSPLVISFKSRYQTSLRSDRERKEEEERKSQRMWKGGKMWESTNKNVYICSEIKATERWRIHLDCLRSWISASHCGPESSLILLTG